VLETFWDILTTSLRTKDSLKPVLDGNQITL